MSLCRVTTQPAPRDREAAITTREITLAEITPPQRLTLLLDESPLKAIQRWLWVLSTGGTLLDGFAIFALGVAMPLIIAEFHIKLEVVGLIGAALVLGGVSGSDLADPWPMVLGESGSCSPT